MRSSGLILKNWIYESSLNPNYPLLTADGDKIIVVGKVLEKAKEK